MKLGILVNTNRHAKDLVGITMTALAKGHEVVMFFMDAGEYLLSNKEIMNLCNEPKVKIAYCDYNAHRLGISKEGIPDRIRCGSQFDNATMNHEADRVIVL